MRVSGVDLYYGASQALRDVATWAEDGVAAPASTRYSIEDAQVVAPELAPQRGGLQPTVELESRSDRIVKAQVGEPLTLAANQHVLLPQHPTAGAKPAPVRIVTSTSGDEPPPTPAGDLPDERDAELVDNGKAKEALLAETERQLCLLYATNETSSR